MGGRSEQAPTFFLYECLDLSLMGNLVDILISGPGCWFPDPDNCRRYWRCHSSGGAAGDLVAEHLICEDDAEGEPMMWDLEYDGCNFAGQTQCGVRPVCDECNDNCRDGECRGHDMDCRDEQNGFYPDPYSCERFWQCDQGNAFHFKVRF